MTELPKQAPFVSLAGRQVPMNYVLWGAAIFAVAFTLRLIWVNYLDSFPTHDGFWYWTAATGLADGNGFRGVGQPEAYTSVFPPGWPFVLAGLQLVFGEDLFVVKFFNVIVGALTAVVVYALASLVRDQRTGVVAGFVMAFFPSQIFFTTTYMTETLFVGLVTVMALALTVLLLGTTAIKGWQVFILGLLMGSMALVRAETLFLVPALLVLWKLLGHRWREIAPLGIVLVIGIAVFVAPWTIRNYVRFDQFILIREAEGGGSSLLRASLSPDYDDLSRIGGGTAPSLRATAEYYATGPWRIGSLGAHKVYDLFKHDDSFHWKSTDDFETGTRLFLSDETNDRWAMLGNGYYYLVGALALMGAPFWFSKGDKRLAVLLWFVACWSLIYLMLVPKVRYHFPSLPMLSILAAATVVTAWDRYGATLLRRTSTEETLLEVRTPGAVAAVRAHEEVRG